ncbi:MAG: putative sulfate exporter family transporter [Porticoccaceae bacterium]|nr:putative sulfate exporter family transporter [Porticoccaceae bacterium]MBT7752493.1 putative sulfate exporter family transporter [Porticoccaceae bacterium]
MDSALSRHKNKFRGIIACILVALASKFLALNYGAPAMLFALILGMSVNFLSESEYSIPGIDFCSSTVLRFGVILLGSKILFGDVLALGWVTALVVVGCMFATILFGALIAKALKLDYRFGMLSGGAVGICGISAAMTLSSVMPKSKEIEHYTLLTVVMVATFGAIAMVVYPVLASFLGLSSQQMGIFIGGSIHDVSHVIGAGYSISEDVGYVAMIVKMLRVALLIPMAWIFLLIFTKQRAASEGRTKLSPPYFLLGFVLLAIINNIGWIPQAAAEVMNTISQDCFVVAIAALGMKTSFKGLFNIGWRPVAMVLSESLFLGGLVLAWVML